jgi:hypothetical protein
MHKDLEYNIRNICKDHFPKINRKEVSQTPDQTPHGSQLGTPLNQASIVKSRKSTKKYSSNRLNLSSEEESSE